jgi:hypothetical protein
VDAADKLELTYPQYQQWKEIEANTPEGQRVAGFKEFYGKIVELKGGSNK